jgi:uncharacterized protein
LATAGNASGKGIVVTLTEGEPGAAIHYTLDGSAPGTSDPVYDKPINIDTTTVVRARAYKEGFTRSIIAQQIFTIGQ